MPRKRQPESLYNSCLVYVAVNFHVPFPEGTSVLTGLPPTISEQIIVVLQQCQPTNYALLCHVLGNVLRFVYLGRLPQNQDIAFRMFRQLRQYGDLLTVLHLPLREEHYDMFVTTLPSLPHLRNLVLHVHDLTEPIADAIASHCLNLINLCLYGIRPGNYMRGVVTDDNNYIIHVAIHLVHNMLERLGLQVLRIAFLTQAILSLPATTRLQLTELVMNRQDLLETAGALSHVITLCPNLLKVCLFFSDENQIEPLARLAFLEDLSLILVNYKSPVNSSDLIHQLLRSVGYKLRRLGLNAPTLDMTIIARYCPALHEFQIDNLERIVNASSGTRRLKELRVLRICLDSPNSLDPSQLHGLLRNYGRLSRVFLRRCHLEDSELRELISSDTFSKLEAFQLEEVHGFSASSLQLLLRAENDLMVIGLIRCPPVTSADVDELRAFVLSMNLYLKVEFVPHVDSWA